MCDLPDGDEACTIWDESALKARKRHGCHTCGATIEPGELYLRIAQLFAGSWSTEKACLACVIDREAFESAHGEVGIAPSYLPEALSRCILEDDEGKARWAPMLAALEARGAVAAEPKGSGTVPGTVREGFQKGSPEASRKGSQRP
jgi:hypothetical protein